MHRLLALVTSIVGLVLWGWEPPRDAPAVTDAAYGVQMHLHSSLSEGSGSMKGHAFQARQSGDPDELLVDVLWYTDHAEMISHFNYEFVASEDFETYAVGAATPLSLAQSEPASLCPGEGFVEVRNWDQPFVPTLALPVQRTTDCVVSDLPGGCFLPEDPGVFLEIGGQCSGGCGPTQFDQSTVRYITNLEKNEKRSLLSEVSLELDVFFPSQYWSTDTALDVQLRLTQDKTGARQSFLHYWFGALDPASLETDSDKYVWVTGPDAPPQSWTTYTLDVSADARALFPLPEESADDQVLRRYEFKALARGSATVRVYLDDFRIVTAGPIGQELYDLQADILQGEVGDFFPDPESEPLQIVGYEMNGTQPGTGHVNVFGTDVPLMKKCQTYDPTSPLFCGPGDPQVDWCEHPTAVVDWAHSFCDEPGERPCLVSYNHMFGTSEATYCSQSSGDAALDLVVEEVGDAVAYNADLIEIGYAQRVEPIHSFLYVWDRIFSSHPNHVVVSGNGVTDTHVNAWQTKNNRMITWGLVDGPEPQKPEDLDFEDRLLRALGDGRSFFGEMSAFVPGADNRLDMELQARIGGSPTCVGRMGSVVELPDANRSVLTRMEATVSGLKSADPGRRLMVRYLVHSADGESALCQTYDGSQSAYSFLADVRLDTHQVLRTEVWDVAAGDTSCAEPPSCGAWVPVMFSNPIWLSPTGEFTDVYGHPQGCEVGPADAAWSGI